MDGVITVHCCRDWEVPAFGGWSACGICGRMPSPVINDIDPKLVNLTY